MAKDAYVIKTAEFVMSEDKLSKLPPPLLPEYAFIGRSNVGKSSLINMLTGHKGLAKTSQTPGKTQTFVHFLINKSWYLVDLPGYGFAKRSKALRDKWDREMRIYFRERPSLVQVFLLVDVRVPPQASDLDLANWLGANSIPFCLVFTKADKLNAGKVEAGVANFLKALGERWDYLPPSVVTSSEKGIGKEDVLAHIWEGNEVWRNREVAPPPPNPVKGN